MEVTTPEVLVTEEEVPGLVYLVSALDQMVAVLLALIQALVLQAASLVLAFLPPKMQEFLR